MSPTWIRSWMEVDIEDLKSHVLLVGELTSNCGKCKEMGLNVETVTHCPNCNAEFRYATSRLAGGSAHERFTIINRIRRKRANLTLIDYDDYKKLLGKSQAEDFLRGG